MSPTLLLLLVVVGIAFVGIGVFFGTREDRRLALAMRDFSALLEGGSFTVGDGKRGPRATGRWKGVDVEVAFFGRFDPPAVLTTVRASRRPSPFAALLLPRAGVPREEPPVDAPKWLERLDRLYDADCAPPEMFRVVVDEAIANLLTELPKTEVEILPSNVNVQPREVLVEAEQLVPFLDAAAALVGRLDALHEELDGPSEDEKKAREEQVVRFLNGFQR